MYLANNDDDNNRDIFLSESGQDHTPVPNQETNDADLAIFDRRDVEIDEETAAELAAEAEDAEDEPDEKTRRPAVSRRNWRPLSKSKELTLIARVQRREPRAADELVEQFRPFLLGLLSKTYSNNPLSFDEKLAAGQQGLIRAAEKFEPDKGWRLSTYARHWIKAKINELTAQLCGSVVKSGDRKINRGRPGDQSFDAPIGFDEDGDAYTLHDALCDDDDNHDAPDVERHDAMSAAVNAALDDRQRKIFVALNLTDNLPTLDELGRQFGISGERVRQINVAAKEKVSHWLSNSLPKSLRKDPDERALTAINIAANAFGSGHCAGGNGKSRSEIHHQNPTSHPPQSRSCIGGTAWPTRHCRRHHGRRWNVDCCSSRMPCGASSSKNRSVSPRRGTRQASQ